MKYRLDEFKSIWNGTSANDILNQFYYEHIELQKALERIANLQIEKSQLTNNWNELEELLRNELKLIREDEFFCNLTNEDYIEFILDKMKEIKEKSNEK